MSTSRPSTNFRSMLLQQSTISALVGTRVMDEAIDSDTLLPAIGYTALPNEGWVENDLAQVAFQVDCWASNRDDAYEVWEAIKATILEGEQYIVGTIRITVIDVEDGNSMNTDPNDFNTHFCQGRILVIMYA